MPRLGLVSVCSKNSFLCAREFHSFARRKESDTFCAFVHVRTCSRVAERKNVKMVVQVIPNVTLLLYIYVQDK